MCVYVCVHVSVYVCMCMCVHVQRANSMGHYIWLHVPVYRVDVFQFLFVDKGVIAERGYKEYGREDFDDK